MDWIGIGALVVSVLLWLFNPSPIRRRLGLEKPLPPPPYYVAGSQLDHLRQDPIVAPVLPADLSRLHWVLVLRPGRCQGQRADGPAGGVAGALTAELARRARLRSSTVLAPPHLAPASTAGCGRLFGCGRSRR